MKNTAFLFLALALLVIGSHAQTRVSIPDPGFDDLALFEVEFQPQETKSFVVNAPADAVLAVSVDTDVPENKAFISLTNGDKNDKWFDDFDDFEILTGSDKDYKIDVQNRSDQPYKTYLYFSLLSPDKFRSISAKDYGPFTDVHQIDFRNGFLYGPVMGDIFRRLRVRNGEADDVGDERGPSFRVLDVVYGDVDNDATDEAIVSVSYWGGGSGDFSDDFVYKLINGKPVVISRFGVGDRAMGGVDKVWIKDGIVYDRRYDSGSHGGACCSEFLITYPLKWNGSDFEIFGKEKKVSRYPVEQIRFEKGAYGEEIHSMIENGEKRVQDAKRFVFRAKSGQVLTLTPIDPNVSFFIYDGDAEKLDPALPNDESVKHTQLKLNETGEYYFMVRKDENFGRDIAFSIDIR